MEKKEKNGFVLMLVIVIMALIGAEMFVLARGSNTILFQSDTAYLQAVERNLAASGLAWAEKNIKGENKESFNKTVELDITDIDVRRSNLRVTIGAPIDKEAQVQINTSCSRGRQTLTSDGKYRIEL